MLTDIPNTEISPLRMVLIFLVAVAAHFLVIAIRRISGRIMTSHLIASWSKVKTLLSLITSMLIFTLYFIALGLILEEFGISLKVYLASASIMGLAIGFGSQGLVQDVVTGITNVFANLFDVGDMVEIAGQTGIVRRIGIRFTVIESSLGAEVFIPNRTISNVLTYPRGHVRCMVDILLPEDGEFAGRMEERITSMVWSFKDQYPGILIHPPEIDRQSRKRSGKSYLRVKLCLWPGRGATIETALKQELSADLRGIDPSFADWMIAVNYEVEKRRLPKIDSPDAEPSQAER